MGGGFLTARANPASVFLGGRDFRTVSSCTEGWWEILQYVLRLNFELRFLKKRSEFTFIPAKKEEKRSHH